MVEREMMKTAFDGGRMMLDKIKDQAREESDLKTLLLEAREIIVKYGCSCCNVRATPRCKRCQILGKIANVMSEGN